MLMDLLFMSIAYSQGSPALKAVNTAIASKNYDDALTKAEDIEAASLSKPDKALFFFLKAKIYCAKNIDDLAYQNYLDAKKEYLALDSLEKAMAINLELSYLELSQKKPNKANSKKYLDEYLEYAKKLDSPLKLARAYAEIASKKINPEEGNESLLYFRKAMVINRSVKDPSLGSLIDNNIAALYNDILNEPDSALFYFKKDLIYLNKQKDNDNISINYINQAASYHYLGDNLTAIKYLKAADTIPVKDNVKGIKYLLYKNMATYYAAIKDYRNAYDSYMLHQAYSDSLFREEYNIAIDDIRTKYDTQQKELENIKLKNKNKTKSILLYTYTGLLVVGIVIGWLVLKNARRREKISRQEKLIEQQKLEKALKDYELHSIDIMLEGQEKERQLIANDLHDNLGSMLATLKINFENLKLRKNELRDEENRLYEKTDELIEEAYQKVRGLAHAKNAGVFANEGLIPAIKKLAQKISIPGMLTIQVAAFGFDDRVENAHEIAIFRIVQELATNIIKHSHATEATISLTHHDDNINIIIEDNGVGFSEASRKIADGMGLDSIQKKVTQMGGQFEIDSTPGNGTTILIDLPI